MSEREKERGEEGGGGGGSGFGVLHHNRRDEAARQNTYNQDNVVIDRAVSTFMPTRNIYRPSQLTGRFVFVC